MSDQSQTKVHFRVLPKAIGGYWLGEKEDGIQLVICNKPSAWNRFWVKFILGWTWEDKNG